MKGICFWGLRCLPHPNGWPVKNFPVLEPLTQGYGNQKTLSDKLPKSCNGFQLKLTQQGIWPRITQSQRLFYFVWNTKLQHISLCKQGEQNVPKCGTHVGYVAFLASFFFFSFLYLSLCIASSVLVDNVVAYLFKLSVQLFMTPLGIDKFKLKFVLHTVYRKLNINKTK